MCNILKCCQFTLAASPLLTIAGSWNCDSHKKRNANGGRWQKFIVFSLFLWQVTEWATGQGVAAGDGQKLNDSIASTGEDAPRSQDTFFLNSPDAPASEVFAISPKSDSVLSWKIRNTSANAIEYVGYSATCSCTSLSLDTVRLEPGQEVNVRAVVRASEGPADRAIDIAATFKSATLSKAQKTPRYVHHQRILFRVRPAIGWPDSPISIRNEPGSSTLMTIVCYSPLRWHRLEATTSSPYLTCETSISTDMRHGAECQIARVNCTRNSIAIDAATREDVKISLHAWNASNSSVSLLVGETTLQINYSSLIELAPSTIFLDNTEGATCDIIVLLRDREMRLRKCLPSAIIDGESISLSVDSFSISHSMLSARLKLSLEEMRRLFKKDGDLIVNIDTSDGHFLKTIPVRLPAQSLSETAGK
jgi:hypothetical protein